MVRKSNLSIKRQIGQSPHLSNLQHEVAFRLSRREESDRAGHVRNRTSRDHQNWFVIQRGRRLSGYLDRLHRLLGTLYLERGRADILSTETANQSAKTLQTMQACEKPSYRGRRRSQVQWPSSARRGPRRLRSLRRYDDGAILSVSGPARILPQVLSRSNCHACCCRSRLTLAVEFKVPWVISCFVDPVSPEKHEPKQYLHQA